MRHEHVGPLDRACEGCLVEAQQLIDEKDRAWWRGCLWALALGALAVSAMLALSWWLSREG